jgi:hypothetical protein
MWKQQFTRRSNYAQVPAPARQFAFHFIAIKLRTLSYPRSNWLELLKEIAPGVARVAVLYNPDTAPYAGTFLRTIEAAAPSFRIEPSTATARNAAEIEGAIAAIAREPGGGVVQIPDSFTLTHREPIVRVIAHHRLPVRTIPTKFDLVINLKARSASPCRARAHRRTCGSPQARSSPTEAAVTSGHEPVSASRNTGGRPERSSVCG